jgi:hypothetical protein
MVSTGLSSTRSGNELSSEEDFPAQIAGSIEQVVGTVRDKTTGPALLIARALVYGTFAAVVSIAAVVLLIVGSVRVLDNYLPSSVFGDDHTWAAHMFVGLAFTIAGALSWRRRK